MTITEVAEVAVVAAAVAEGNRFTWIYSKTKEIRILHADFFLVKLPIDNYYKSRS